MGWFCRDGMDPSDDSQQVAYRAGSSATRNRLYVKINCLYVGVWTTL